MKITVVALGKVGLPVAVYYAARGHRVTGCDIDGGVVAHVTAGRSPIAHEPGLAERLADAVERGALTATTDTAAGVAGADVVIVLVPLDVDERGEPAFGPMDAAFEQIARGLTPGTLVVLETTAPVGTCRSRYLPLLESHGLRHDRDLWFAFSPERLQSGRIERDLATYPRVVGGLSEAATARAAAFYRAAFDVPVIELANAEAAEFCKLAESIYRDVNIALANELARLAVERGVDFHAVLPAANSQPQSHLHRPGLGVGGHCIPVYPYFLGRTAAEAPLTRLARTVNDGQPRRAADLLDAALCGLAGRRVLVLGLTYRPGVKETAHSPAVDLGTLVRARGAVTFGHDPLLGEVEVAALGFVPATLDQPPEVDAVVLHTADPAYAGRELAGLGGAVVVLDAPGALDPAAVTAAGVAYLALGRPSRRPAAAGRPR